MSLFNIAFSPTGGTKKVADILACEIGSDVTPVNLCEKTYDSVYIHFNADDVCIFAVPSYGGRVPQTAIDRISKMHGVGTRAVAVVVYGNREQEDTLLELCDTLESAGFFVAAGVVAIAEHSVIRTIAAGRPDADDEAVLKAFAKQISAKLEEMTEPAKPLIPGNTPYKARGGGMRPAADENCIKCGKCAAECPVGAIPSDAPDLAGGENCISCMRCISVCPNGARAIDKELYTAISQKLGAVCAIRKECELFI